ncbi:uncharacterized protein [Apostichopus japonicus]|uniref:uncharacterized protein isoform X2 n=1 Tax=Stichopus japonicus TaxID=307972 RepID=UPI003AB719E5
MELVTEVFLAMDSVSDPDSPLPVGILKDPAVPMSEEVNNNEGLPSPDGSSKDGSTSDAPPARPTRPSSVAEQFRPMTNEQTKQEPVSPPPLDNRSMYEEREASVSSPGVIGEIGKEHGEYRDETPSRLSVLTGHYNRDKTDYETADNLTSYFEYDSSMERLEVECGPNKAYLFIDNLCQGSKGKCIDFKGHLLTPNEFQSISGRETAKDWKRSIRHRGKSLKTLMSRGLLKAHPVLCECHSCKSGPRNLKGEKKGLLNQTSSRHHLDDMSIDNFREYSSIRSANLKRARSASPVDDIYDEEQRKLFEMANSPEPNNIESLQRSLAADSHQSGLPSSPAERITTSDINHNESMSSSSSILTSYYTVTKPVGKNRKQTAPKHLDVKKEVKEKVPHIALTTFSTNFKSHQPMRPRYHQASQSLTVPPGPSSAGEGGSSSKRARSLFTPTSKSPSLNVRMIELTRPAQSSSDKAGTPNSLANGDDPNYRQSASSTSDTVFLPSDIANWSVDDVAEFVRSLKGCEDYSQVFREQAIDGEILPVLTEEHLLHNMGLKLGPALKIKINVAKRLGYQNFIDEMQ